jgi:hypothetical protein
MSDTLIFGTSYIGDEDRLWLVQQWCEMTTRLNPGCDVIAVHTPSEIDFPKHPKVGLYEFSDNIGHLDDPTLQGRDGWGRAFTIGLSIAAMSFRYRHVVHIECDVLFRHPVDSMLRIQPTKAAAPIAVPHQIPESALMFFRDVDAGWLQNLIAAYDWPSMQPSRRVPMPELPEQRLQRILGDELYVVAGLWGARCEGAGMLSVEQASQVDWITHASRAQYEAFLASVN